MGIHVVGTTTPRLDLGQAINEWVAAQDKYIASQVLPTTPVPKKKAVLDVLERGALAADIPSIERAAGAGYKKANLATSEMSYSCKEFGIEFDLDDSEVENYATQFDYEQAAMQRIVNAILIRRERVTSAAVFNTSTWTGSDLYLDVSATPWATATTDIMANINTGIDKIQTNAGVMPNTLIVSYYLFRAMCNNDNIVTASVYTQGAAFETIANSIAAYFGLDKILVGRAPYNSAGFDASNTFTGATIWSNNYAMLCYTPVTSDLTENCMGRTFLWSQDSPSDMVIEQYRDDARRCDVLRVRHQIDPKIIDASCGFLFKVA